MTRTLQQLEPYLQGYWPLKTDFKDNSQNSNDGTPTTIEWKPTSRGLKPDFDGNTSKIAIGNVYDGIKSVSFWVKLASTTEDLVDLNATATVDINAGIVRGNNFIIPTIYVDGQATASLSDLTGFHHIVITTATGIDASAVDIGEIAISFGEIFIEDIRFYSVVLTTDEILNLYNYTKYTYGMIPAERSYTHQLGIKPEDGLVLGFDGHTKNADRTFTDMSGESNHGTNVGTSRYVGYFGEIRSFDGVNDLINCGSNTILDNRSSRTILVLYKPTLLTSYKVIASKGLGGHGGSIQTSSSYVQAQFYTGSVWKSVTSDITLLSDKVYLLAYVFDNDLNTLNVYIDTSVKTLTGVTDIPDDTSGEPYLIGDQNTTPDYSLKGNIYTIQDYNRALSLAEIKSKFNQLATLPLFYVNFTDYPDNEDVSYTDNESIPYSTMRVGSNGTFKIDDDQLVCSENTSTLTLRNNHEFDGSEYITIDIGGTKYSGTGTITQGTVTVSIAQGSKFITVAMSDTDVLNSIDIQFRAEVS